MKKFNISKLKLLHKCVNDVYSHSVTLEIVRSYLTGALDLGLDGRRRTRNCASLGGSSALVVVFHTAAGELVSVD